MAERSDTVGGRRNRLRRIMTRNGITAVDVAELTLYKPQTVRAYMCGARDVPPRLLKMLEVSLPTEE